jgi:EAL and modified HD-GYP domain-containing signal transduction protein
MTHPSSSGTASGASHPPVFLAREPILDRRQQVFGYRLQVRHPADADRSSAEAARIVEAVHALGLDARQRVFVPVSRRLLLDGVPALLRADRAVIEICEDVVADRAVQDACADLRRAGYDISVECPALEAGATALLPFASYLKFDVHSGPEDARTRARTLSCLAPGVSGVIATGIETFDQFEMAAAEGFTAFQGFFLGRPALVAPQEVPGAQVARLRLLRALNDANASIAALEDIVKHDAGLCYRLLRTVNSAAVARRTPVQSIADALLMCGRDRVRRWASLWVLKGLNERAHVELVTRSTVRARCCELLAGSVCGDEAFLMGMCSLLDAILDRPMPSIVAELPLGDLARQALCGEPNVMRDILECVVAYEHARWEECETMARRARLDAAVLPAAFVDALRWMREVTA